MPITVSSFSFNTIWDPSTWDSSVHIPAGSFFPAELLWKHQHRHEQKCVCQIISNPTKWTMNINHSYTLWSTHGHFQCFYDYVPAKLKNIFQMKFFILPHSGCKEKLGDVY